MKQYSWPIDRQILTLFSPINACKGKLDHVQKWKLKLYVFVETDTPPSN